MARRFPKALRSQPFHWTMFEWRPAPPNLSSTTKRATGEKEMRVRGNDYEQIFK
jgi:hypothetical protein